MKIQTENESSKRNHRFYALLIKIGHSKCVSVLALLLSLDLFTVNYGTQYPIVEVKQTQINSFFFQYYLNLNSKQWSCLLKYLSSGVSMNKIHRAGS